MSREISRKELLRGVLSFLREVTDEALPARDRGRGRPAWPPGALTPSTVYVATCTGCEDCVAACPHSAIVMVEDPETGSRRVAALEPGRKPCRMCTGLPCVVVCKPGALIDPGSPRLLRLGVAQVDPRACRTFRGVPCDLCVRACPLPGEAIRLVGTRPLVMTSTCTGCGLCAVVCPDRAVTVIPERELVAGLRIPREFPRSGRLPG